MPAGPTLPVPPESAWDAGAALAAVRHDCAAMSGSAWQDLDLDIAGVRLRLRFAGDPVAELLAPPFRHVRAAAPGAPDITIVCRDTTTTGRPLPAGIGDPEAVQRYALSPGMRDSRYLAALRRADYGLSLFDRERSWGFYWLPDAVEAPYRDDGLFYGSGNPLRALLSWAFADRGWVMAHTAVVGRDGRAVLVTGASGAGKSTTALRCLQAGFDFLGDDMALIRPDPEPRAASVYATAKVFRAGHPRRPHALDLDGVPATYEFEKAIHQLFPHYAPLLAREARLVGVVAVRIADRGESRVVPCSRGEAFAALAPTSAILLPGASARSLRTMREVVDRLPCFRLEAGTDPAAVAPAIGGLLERLEPGTVAADMRGSG